MNVKVMFYLSLVAILITGCKAADSTVERDYVYVDYLADVDVGSSSGGSGSGGSSSGGTNFDTEQTDDPDPDHIIDNDVLESDVPEEITHAAQELRNHLCEESFEKCSDVSDLDDTYDSVENCSKIDSAQVEAYYQTCPNLDPTKKTNCFSCIEQLSCVDLFNATYIDDKYIGICDTCREMCTSSNSKVINAAKLVGSLECDKAYGCHADYERAEKIYSANDSMKECYSEMETVYRIFFNERYIDELHPLIINWTSCAGSLSCKEYDYSVTNEKFPDDTDECPHDFKLKSF